MRALVLALALLAAPLAGCASSPPADTQEGEAPSWSFIDTEGTKHSEETAAGSPTVIFFMATWCSSCQKKTSDLKQVHDDYAEAGVEQFSVTVDPGEDEDDLERWKEEYAQPWPHGVDEDAQLQQTFGIERQSNVVVLDAQGLLVEHWGYGSATYEEIAEVLDGLEG